MQLIKITTTPIEYKFQIERPRLEANPGETPKMDITTTEPDFKVQVQNAQIRLDTAEMRSSIGLKSAPTLIGEAAQRGYEMADRAKADAAKMGNQLAQIQTGITVADVVSQKLQAQPVSQTVFLPSKGPVISWVPNSIDMQYKAGETSIDWKITENTMNYVPGKFQMDILQYPKIQIEYLGEPNYVPPSASPNYEE